MKIVIDRKPENEIPKDLLEAAKKSLTNGGLSIYPATGPYSDNLIMIFRGWEHVGTFTIEPDGSCSLANADAVTSPDKLGTIGPYKITGPAFKTLTIS